MAGSVYLGVGNLMSMKFVHWILLFAKLIRSTIHSIFKYVLKIFIFYLINISK